MLQSELGAQLSRIPQTLRSYPVARARQGEGQRAVDERAGIPSILGNGNIDRRSLTYSRPRGLSGVCEGKDHGTADDRSRVPSNARG